ncbi:MAG: hypothetical protein ABJO82_00870 [Nonlabens ulvanivorans]
MTPYLYFTITTILRLLPVAPEDSSPFDIETIRLDVIPFCIIRRLAVLTLSFPMLKLSVALPTVSGYAYT